jgi:hypothetical protein
MTEETYYCGLCKAHMPLAHFPHDTDDGQEPINLSAQSVAKQEPLEDTVTLVRCPYCRGHHQKFMIDACPMNPYRP